MSENQDQKPSWLISADRPIKHRADDAFGRAPFAKAMARQLRQLQRGESYVVGLQGPWGSGKTSILNMITEELEGLPEMGLLQFNPWLFSGSSASTRGEPCASS
jgi:predicted KAP-like P-loop ATPase